MELLSPAGDFDTARTAFAAGADAVYIGMTSFSARADAKNFSEDELARLVAYAHDPRCGAKDGKGGRPRKVYVALNTVVDDGELGAAVELLASLAQIGPDAIIVQDIGVASIAAKHFPELELHASTQLVAHNLEGVLAMKELGFRRVVLARELSLEDIASITKRCGVEIEVFVHGALCYSVSGLCLFSAMEKDRSGNRGRCAYCCRLGYADDAGRKTLPFSMRDLRLDGAIGRLAEAGVASLKIEGRMKSHVYVGAASAYYRALIDGVRGETDLADLETVFSRRVTSLYAGGYGAKTESIIDSGSLGHIGTPIGVVKRITRDREGRPWLRFHTSRALERHDGLQFSGLSQDPGRPVGIGIGAMRLAISRKNVFECPAGSDVEILLDPPPDGEIRPGMNVYCSASNAVRRRFQVPPFRPSDFPSGRPVSIEVKLDRRAVAASARAGGIAAEARIERMLDPAREMAKTPSAVKNAFARLGESAWRAVSVKISDPDGVFAPPSLLNDLRRDLAERLDDAAAADRASRIAAAVPPCRSADPPIIEPVHTVRLRLDQIASEDVAAYDEAVVSIGRASGREAESALASLAQGMRGSVRLALPVFTLERDFGRMRSAVRHLMRTGYLRWEASDLATLRMLRQLGATDISADWTLYAFNRAAVALLRSLGVGSFVVSPENRAGNLDALCAEAGAEFLVEQRTPLFISMTRPAAAGLSRLAGANGEEFAAFELDGLWVTSRLGMREFRPPRAAARIRTDLSWNAFSSEGKNSIMKPVSGSVS